MKAFSTVFMLLLTAGPVAAGLERDQHVRYELLADVEQIVPGKTFTVALRMLHDAEWHTYWKQPGIAGIPTQLVWDLPAGFKAGPILWQQPQRTKMAAYTVYGYEGEAYLLTEITAPKDLKAGDKVTLKTKITWMMCAQTCLPSTTKAELVMTVGEKEVPVKKVSAVFEEIRSGFPRVGKSWTMTATRSGEEEVRLVLVPGEGSPAVKAADVYFFSSDGLIHSDARQTRSVTKGGKVELRLQVSEFGPEDADRLRGEIVLEGKTGWEKGDATFTSMTVDVPFEKR